MSTAIELYFKRSLDLELLEKGIQVYLIRLMVLIQFKVGNDWSRQYEAIIDTGAPVSVIPHYIHQHVDVEILGDYRISGIVPKPQCSLPVKVGEIGIRLLDRKSVSKHLKLLSYFAPTDKVPVIIGFEGLLAKSRINFNYEKASALLYII